MDSGKRKALRKERHQITEKLRRKRINEALATLSDLCGLPDQEERAVILESAVKMIQDLQLGDSITPIPSSRPSAPASKRSHSLRGQCRASNLSRSSSMETHDQGVQTEPLPQPSSCTVSSTASSPINEAYTAPVSSAGSFAAMDDEPIDTTIDSFAVQTDNGINDSSDTSKLDELLGFLSEQAEHHRVISTASLIFQQQSSESTPATMPLLQRFRNDQTPMIEDGHGVPTIPLPFGGNEVGHCMFVGVRIVQANAALARMCGLVDPQDLVGGVNLNFRVREDLVFSGSDLLEFMFGQRRVMKTVERMRRTDGSLVWVAAESIRTSHGVDVLPTTSCYIVPVATPVGGPSATFA